MFETPHSVTTSAASCQGRVTKVQSLIHPCAPNKEVLTTDFGSSIAWPPVAPVAWKVDPNREKRQGPSGGKMGIACGMIGEPFNYRGAPGDAYSRYGPEEARGQ